MKKPTDSVGAPRPERNDGDLLYLESLIATLRRRGFGREAVLAVLIVCDAVLSSGDESGILEELCDLANGPHAGRWDPDYVCGVLDGLIFVGAVEAF